MNRPIVAIITGTGSMGAISVVRLSGAGSIRIADEFFRSKSGKPLNSMKGYTSAFGKIFNGNDEVDEVITTVFRSPYSYTGEDTVEISCHGGKISAGRILRLALKHGASPAEAGEYTKRAFLNGKLSLTKAEAVMELISANSISAANMAMNAMGGKLYSEIDEEIKQLLSLSGNLAAWIDYPDEDIEIVSRETILSQLQNVKIKLGKLSDSYDNGRLIRDGISIAIVGKPNVGKSSLMNFLSGYQRSIVTDIPGTTRDIVEDRILLGDYLLNVADTAGIRTTEDKIEQLGVALSKEKIQQSDLILAVFDSSNKLDKYDFQLIEAVKDKNVIAVVNKTDLESRLDTKQLEEYFENTLQISAITDDRTQYQSFINQIESILNLKAFDITSPQLQNERQLNCINRCLEELEIAISTVKDLYTLDAVAITIDEVISILLELTGEKVSEKVVEQVFSHFCVGK